jgi:fumarate reductase subunit C
MSVRSQTYLWAAQRISAMVLGVCVLVHLVTLIYAVRGGLSAAEILARTKGSLIWGTFYALFVVAVAVHVPIGLRTIGLEWLNWRGRSCDAVAILAGLVLATLGGRALWAVVG